MWLELRLSVGRSTRSLNSLASRNRGLGCPACSIPRLLGIGGNRDLLPHLETHLKVFGNLVQIAPELIRGRRSVERRVVPHGPEERLALVLILAILPQALPGKRALGILPCVDLALPAFVGPSRGAEANQGRERESRTTKCTGSLQAISTRSGGNEYHYSPLDPCTFL